MIVKRIGFFIEQGRLLSRDGLHLVAVSGGADSVCLLLVLRELGYRVEAVHCNFHLRGAESDRDEAFVKELCASKDIELHLTHFDTRAYAALHKVSMEMAARELRYHYFEQLRRDIGAETICVAHHQDDNAETVLMNLLRGTGLRGLQGIQPRRGFIVRPLLCVSRRDIEQWLKVRGQHYVTDSTNMVADVVRNKLRLDIIPRLHEVFPRATANILTTARFAGEALRVYDDAVTARLSLLLRRSSTVGNASERCSIEELLQEPSPEAILFEWLSPAGFTSATVVQLCSMLPRLESGREWSSATHTLVSHSGFLVLEKKDGGLSPLHIPEPGTYVCGGRMKLRISFASGQHIERGNALVCCADAHTVTFPLTVRRVRPGDRFRPLGMKGTKLVSDFLTDLHLPLTEKRRQLAVCDARGYIVWLVGRRMDDTKKVTAETAVTLRISVDT